MNSNLNSGATSFCPDFLLWSSSHVGDARDQVKPCRALSGCLESGRPSPVQVSKQLRPAGNPPVTKKIMAKTARAKTEVFLEFGAAHSLFSECEL